MFRKGAPRPRAAGLSVALLAAASVLAAGCGTAPGTVRPARATAPGVAAGGPPGASGTARGSGPGLLSWPPFGPDAHIVLPRGLPRGRRVARAVIVAEDFLLAFLYAEYRGNQDDRWSGFAWGPVRGALESNLAEPDVTTESFTGMIVFSHLSAFPDPTEPGAIDVSECFDNAGSANTSLATGKVIPDRAPANQHYYLNTDVLAFRNRQWRVISVDPVIYYPQARECKP